MDNADIRHGVYTGPIEALRGKGALVRPFGIDERTVLAQFDDLSTGYACGWHFFQTHNFTLDPENG